MGNDCLVGVVFSLGIDEYILKLIDSIVNVLNATEFNTLKWLTWISSQ